MSTVMREHESQARWLVAETHRGQGLAPVDIEQFWAEQAIALEDLFGAAIPQVPLGIMMSGECVFDELEIPEDYWRYDHDELWRLELNRAYNDRAERIVGRRLLHEMPGDPDRVYPPVKGLHDLFEAEHVWIDRSWWLMPAAQTEDELEALLDRVEDRLGPQALRCFMLPENWDEEKERLLALGIDPPLYRGQRGPVTFAMSVYGAEKLIFLLLQNPGLGARFRDTIINAMRGMVRLLDEEAGHTPATSPRGFYFCDDNCCLLTPDLYEFFGFPILESIFSTCSPSPGDTRGQHSDSTMGHLLPLFARLGMTSVNFGPTVTVSEIRQHCPNAVIDGQLAPFTFSRNEEESIVREFLRDFEMARELRGLRFATAGSINNGSRLTGMRLIMAAIQHFGRYGS